MTGRARGQAMRPLRTTDVVSVRPDGARSVLPVVVPTAPSLARRASAMNVGEWRRNAACAASDPETFFPRTYRQDEQVRSARRICGRCPVRAVCLADVMATEDPARRWGICGGTTPSERTALHRAGLTITVPGSVGGDAA